MQEGRQTNLTVNPRYLFHDQHKNGAGFRGINRALRVSGIGSQIRFQRIGSYAEWRHPNAEAFVTPTQQTENAKRIIEMDFDGNVVMSRSSIVAYKAEQAKKVERSQQIYAKIKRTSKYFG